MSTMTPAICGQAVCGKTVCGRTVFNLEADNYGAADHGENPKINLATGRMIYEHASLSIGGGTYAVGVSLLYNSMQRGCLANRAAGWKLNVDQALIKYGDTYKHIDARGEVNTYLPFDVENNRYYNSDDAGNVLTISSDGQAEIGDAVGNKLRFDADGKIAGTVSAMNANVAKEIAYDAQGRILKLYDKRLKFTDKIRSYLLFEYDAQSGMLKSVAAIDRYSVTAGKELYEYDASGNLIKILRAAFNAEGEETDRKTICEFYYQDGVLKAIADSEAKSALCFTYDSSDRISEQKFGVLSENAGVLGVGIDLNNSFAFAGPRISEQGGQGLSLGGRSFVEKGKNTYSYLADGGKTYETRITNEKGVKLSFFLDTRYRIVSQFERTASNRIRTLKKEGARRMDLRTYSSHTSNGELINGKCAYTNSVFSITPGGVFNLDYYAKDEDRFFACSFWLKHALDQDRLKVKFEYRLTGETSYRTQYVWVNGRAKNAWQSVTATIELARDGDGEYNCRALDSVRISLCHASGSGAGSFMISDLYFASAPQVIVSVRNGTYTFALDDVGKITASGADMSCTITDNRTATETYFTENDLLRTLMNIHGHSVTSGGAKIFDVICNDGRKRLSRAKFLIFYKNSSPISLQNNNFPLVTKTVMSNDKVRIEQYYEFQQDGFILRSRNYYRENGTQGGSSDKDHSTTSEELYSYKGLSLRKTDEYGLKTVYEYDQYGQLIRSKNVAPDNTVGSLSEIVYDENEENIRTTMSGYSSADQSYLSPFALVGTKTDNFYDETQNAYSNTSDVEKTTYNAYFDRITRVARYNGGTSPVGKNEITYENGRIRTVSDGYVKYGARHDFVNDKMEYTRFSGGTESVVETDTIERSADGETHTSTFNGNSNAAIATQFDKYGRTAVISEGGTEKVTYTWQDGSESDSVQKLSSLTDDFEGRETVYNYDYYNRLCGWTKGTDHLKVQQITAGDTKYTFGSNEKYCARVAYDEEKLLSPRITSTGVAYDPNNDSDDDFEELIKFRRNYTYDGLGRLTEKTCSENIAFSSIERKCEYRYLKIGESETEVPKAIKYTLSSFQPVPGGSESQSLIREEAYSYDKRGNLSGITIGCSGLLNQNGVINNYVDETQTKTYSYDSLNRLISENDSMFGARSYSYGANGKLSSVTKSGVSKALLYDSLGQLLSYDGAAYTYDGMGNRKSKTSNAQTTTYSYTRGNLLAGIGSSISYSYNAEGVRWRKVANGVTTMYYLDGDKILGEDRSDGKKLRYFYDIDGVCGVRYNNTNYEYVRNAYGDVVMIVSGTFPVARYYYDAWGNCRVETYGDNDIATVNPFRWKGHYYDAESGLYYANGSYYDPAIGLHVDAARVASVFENAFEVFGLDILGVMCDNILAYLPCVRSLFASTELSADPTYDPDANKPWWELAWKAVVNWFASVLEWWNSIPIGWKIFGGIALLAAACIIAVATGGAGAGALAAVGNVLLNFMIGLASDLAITVGMAFLTGGDVADALIHGLADGVFFGGLFAFVSASVGAIKAVNKVTYDFELDPRSIELAKQGNPSFGTFRKRVWQYEAIFNRSNYTTKQLSRMTKGLAPKVDGVSMQLHHVVGKANDMYNVVKLTKSQHILFHKTYGYHYNSNWNMQNIINLFG